MMVSKLTSNFVASLQTHLADCELTVKCEKTDFIDYNYYIYSVPTITVHL